MTLRPARPARGCFFSREANAVRLAGPLAEPASLAVRRRRRCVSFWFRQSPSFLVSYFVQGTPPGSWTGLRWPRPRTSTHVRYAHESGLYSAWPSRSACSQQATFALRLNPPNVAVPNRQLFLGRGRPIPDRGGGCRRRHQLPTPARRGCGSGCRSGRPTSRRCHPRYLSP